MQTGQKTDSKFSESTHFSQTHLSSQNPSKSILACDVGLKRIGLATLNQGIIFPLEPIIRHNRNQAANDLHHLIQEREVEVLVVGLPSGEGKYEDTRKRIEYFISLLEFQGQIFFINEDYTSQEALESTFYMGRKKRAKVQKDGRLDSLSACEILSRYLENA